MDSDDAGGYGQGTGRAWWHDKGSVSQARPCCQAWPGMSSPLDGCLTVPHPDMRGKSTQPLLFHRGADPSALLIRRFQPVPVAAALADKTLIVLPDQSIGVTFPTPGTPLSGTDFVLFAHPDLQISPRLNDLPTAHTQGADEALVMSLCDTLEEALEEQDAYGDAVVMACAEDEPGALAFVGLVG
jgi:hypothetical protein